VSDAARSVPCPVCKARVGASCTSVLPSDWGGTHGGSNLPMRRHHKERVNVYWAASRLREELRKP
jgi:hypothetical protein